MYLICHLQVSVEVTQDINNVSNLSFTGFVEVTQDINNVSNLSFTGYRRSHTRYK